MTEKSIAVIGLGYVGLPLAVEFGKRRHVIGFDTNKNRLIEKSEKEAWPNALRHAALRFWLSRLHDKHFPLDGEITHQLDPNDFKLILIDRIQNHYNLHID